MKRALLLFLLCACAHGAPPRQMAPPPWAAEQPLYLDPHPEAAVWLNQGFMEDTTRLTAEQLAKAGFPRGAPADAETISIKLIEIAGIGGAGAIVAQLRRSEALVGELEVETKDLACWTFMAMPAEKAACVSAQLAATIAEAPQLAKLHAARHDQAAAVVHLSGRLAVLELRNSTSELTPRQARYFTDLVRSATLQSAPQLEVITRENLLVLLQSSGKDLANCEGECEVDTGRRIGADAIVSGEIQKIGKNYKIALRLHETHEGRLLAASVASGETVESLDDETTKAAAQLFAGVKP